ncbi:MAG: glycine/sarcosine/betaine reductase selenoprotein B family protein [Deferrisomatales bacterium]
MASLLDKTRDTIRKKYPPFEFTVFDDTPVAPLGKPLSECTLALLTTGGLHLKTDPPFDTKYLEGDCSYRKLPGDVGPGDIAISHESYDHKFIRADWNCVFPLDRMREYVREGRIGALSDEHYSFMGHIYVTGPLLENAREVGRRLRSLGVDAAFLTPT